jgi:hypothetical protein
MSSVLNNVNLFSQQKEIKRILYSILEKYIEIAAYFDYNLKHRVSVSSSTTFSISTSVSSSTASGNSACSDEVLQNSVSHLLELNKRQRSQLCDLLFVCGSDLATNTSSRICTIQ